MAETAAFDFHRLLAPITEDAPTGIDCRNGSTPCNRYWTVRDLRNRARATERKNLFEDEQQDVTASWRQVAGTTQLILATQSKDLEVACWLTEALIRLEGFGGLKNAFELLHGLVTCFWDELHPGADASGIENRVMPLAGLNGEGTEGVLLTAIRTCSFFTDSTGRSFSYWHYQQVLEADRLEDELHQKKIAKLGYCLDDVRKAAADARSADMALLRRNVEACRDMFRSLNQELERLCGVELAPPSSAIVNLLGDCLDAVDHLTGGKYAPSSFNNTNPANTTADPSTETPPRNTLQNDSGIALLRVAEQWRCESPDSSVPFLLEQIAEFGETGGHQLTRQQAFAHLAKIADYFHTREPHSPVPYLLDRIQRWGAMPLADLVEELIPNEAALQHFSVLTGVTKEAKTLPTKEIET